MASPELTRDLIKLIVDLAWFFESADDDAINADDAVRQLELIAFTLDGHSDADRDLILSTVAEMADEAPTPEAARFIADFPVSMGLIEPADSDA
ncbi:hypothetical protein [Actinomadura fibrosa]|uniref:MafI family immunity protein n=1 Tax=Actinomadura fibrosa TaxID=111802 RepID=A0ABW2XDN0_9ACTN|nr:hypothetical protein [Actinomadura fibrosa]